VSLAQLSGAKIHLVHVLLEPVQALDVAAALPYPDVEVRKEWEQAARIKLEREVKAAEKRGVTTTAEIRWGRPSDTIVDTATRHKATLIILGTHGRSVLEKFLLGSTAERVLRLSAVPVLTVREKKKK
jgi:nucleotide-binding universal stress UspA family protein